MRRWIAVLLALLFLSGCAAGNAPQGPAIYYAVHSGSGYGRAAVQGEPWTDAPENAGPEELVRQMLTAPLDNSLYVIFPPKVRLLSWTLEDELLTLDFSEEYNELSGIALTLANYCLVLTMTQLESVDRLSITVEGRPLPESSQTPLTVQDVLLTGEIQDPVLVGFQLYFPLADRSGLGTEYREAELYNTSLEEQIQTVIRLLAAGAQETDEMDSPFAELEVSLESQMVDGVCLLTLTESWAEILAGEPLVRQALVNSLCELSGVDAVVFDWSGAAAESLEGPFQAVYD